MFRFGVLFFALILPSVVFAQSATNQPVNTPVNAPVNANDNSLLQEQAAICASYARLMEYSGLLEKTQGELWRERRFFAGAMLRSTISNATNIQPSNANIDSIITEYSTWMIDLFTANAVQDNQDKLAEKDKLKDYIESFCTGLFNNADKAIVKVRPDLFIGVKAENPNSATPSLVSEAEINQLLQENIKLQKNLKQLENRLSEQDKALKLAEAKAEIAEQMLKNEVTASEMKQVSQSKTAQPKTAQSATDQSNRSRTASSTSDQVDAQLTETLMPPPLKPPLPLNLAAKDGDVIDTPPPLPPEEVGLTQVQLASYSTVKNAENGLNVLAKEMPDGAGVSLKITTARLSSGKNVFRIVSSAIPVETAKKICTHYWAQQYACIIKMTKAS